MRTSRLHNPSQGTGWIVPANTPLVQSAPVIPEHLAVDLPFLNSANGRLKLGGIYRKQQTSYDIHTIRFFLQEDGYGQKALSILCDYVVGAKGITVDFGDDYSNNLWKNHPFDAMHPERGPGEIQRFMVKSLARDGEYLNQIVADWESFYTPSIDVLDLPLNTIKTVGNNDVVGIGFTRQYDSGIDRDVMKRPVSYRFQPELGRPYMLLAENVVHNFGEMYAGQERGLSWFIGCVDTMAELSGFETNVAQAVRNAASDPGFYSVAPRWFQPVRAEDAASVDQAQSLLNRTVTRAPDKRGILPEGIDWHPSDIGNVFTSDVTKSHRMGQLARIAACVGLSYFTVSGDLSSANFSSLQQGNLDNRALFRATQQLILESVKQIVKRWVLWQSLRSSGMQRRLRGALTNPAEEIGYIMPMFEYIDRGKAAAADRIDLEDGTNSPIGVILSKGQDPKTVFRQIAESERLLRDAYDEQGLDYPDDKKSLTNGQEDGKVESAEDSDSDDKKESDKNE